MSEQIEILGGPLHGQHVNIPDGRDLAPVDKIRLPLPASPTLEDLEDVAVQDIAAGVVTYVRFDDRNEHGRSYFVPRGAAFAQTMPGVRHVER